MYINKMSICRHLFIMLSPGASPLHNIVFEWTPEIINWCPESPEDSEVATTLILEEVLEREQELLELDEMIRQMEQNGEFMEEENGEDVELGDAGDVLVEANDDAH